MDSLGHKLSVSLGHKLSVPSVHMLAGHRPNYLIFQVSFNVAGFQHKTKFSEQQIHEALQVLQRTLCPHSV